MNETLAIKNQLIDEFSKQIRNGLYGKIQKMMAFNSNRIEGSTLTSEHTASLFDTGTLYSDTDEIFRAKDIEEMNGHFKMFNEMIKTLGKPLDEDIIKSFHYHLKIGVFEDMANGYAVGDYKKRANTVSDIKTCEPQDVAKKMTELLKKYSSADSLEDFAAFHAEYEIIHPFQDGNGRTGRIILLKQCLDHNIYPVIIEDRLKAEYYAALQSYQKNDGIKKLVSFLEKEQENLKQEITGFIEPSYAIQHSQYSGKRRGHK